MNGSRWEACTRRARALAAEAGSLTAVGHAPVDATWLRSAVGWLAEVAPTWEAMSGAVPDRRSYRRLIASPAIEAWLICWPRDGRLELHDHGGASGAFAVLEGSLDERSLRGRPGPDDHLVVDVPRPHERTVAAGMSVAFDGSYIHDVRNVDLPAATSVHVYSAAQRPMSFYRFDGGLLRSVDLGASRSLIEAESAAERDGDPVAGRPGPAPAPAPRRRAMGAHPSVCRSRREQTGSALGADAS